MRDLENIAICSKYTIFKSYNLCSNVFTHSDSVSSHVASTLACFLNKMNDSDEAYSMFAGYCSSTVKKRTGEDQLPHREAITWKQ